MSTTRRGDATTARELIPGAYDRSTLTHRQPGSMGSPGSGSEDLPIGPSLMDAATIADRENEGGGRRRASRFRDNAMTQHRGDV